MKTDLTITIDVYDVTYQDPRNCCTERSAPCFVRNFVSVDTVHCEVNAHHSRLLRWRGGWGCGLGQLAAGVVAGPVHKASAHVVQRRRFEQHNNALALCFAEPTGLASWGAPGVCLQLPAGPGGRAWGLGPGAGWACACWRCLGVPGCPCWAPIGAPWRPKFGLGGGKSQGPTSAS